MTDFRRPQKCLSFSFNPKNVVFIMTDEVPDFIFVTEFVTKNVIFVTAATNRPCNSLIINYAYRVKKSPWKVHDFLHREIKIWYSISYILYKAWDWNLKLVETYSLQSIIRLYPWFHDYGRISLILVGFVTVFVTKSPSVTEFCHTYPKKLPKPLFYEMLLDNSHE